MAAENDRLLENLKAILTDFVSGSFAKQIFN